MKQCRIIGSKADRAGQAAVWWGDSHVPGRDDIT